MLNIWLYSRSRFLDFLISILAMSRDGETRHFLNATASLAVGAWYYRRQKDLWRTGGDSVAERKCQPQRQPKEMRERENDKRGTRKAIISAGPKVKDPLNAAWDNAFMHHCRSRAFSFILCTFWYAPELRLPILYYSLLLLFFYAFYNSKGSIVVVVVLVVAVVVFILIQLNVLVVECRWPGFTRTPSCDSRISVCTKGWQEKKVFNDIPHGFHPNTLTKVDIEL